MGGAVAAKYHEGSCFDGMGTHHFLDLEKGPQMTWKSSALMPVVPMYDKGVITAVFFATPWVQQSILPPSTNQWEPIPLINTLMCRNLCDSDCTWHGTSIWSTQHWYFNNYQDLKCPSNYDCFISGIGCCPP